MESSPSLQPFPGELWEREAIGVTRALEASRLHRLREGGAYFALF